MTTLETVSNSRFDGALYAKEFLTSLMNGTRGPQPQLEETLHQLAKKGPQAFYNGSIGLSIVNELQRHSVSWEVEKDLGSYQVQIPQQIEVCF